MIPSDDPFNPFDRTVRQMIDQLSNLDRNAHSPQQIPYADQYKEDGNLVITMDIPGVDKNDIDIDIQNRGNNQILRITGEENETNIQRRFRQQIPLKEKVDPTEGEAEYNNGILTVRLPIEEDSQSTSIDIN